MAFFMSAFMSFVVTLLNVGLTDDLINRWLTAWPKSFIIALPAIMLIGPAVKSIVERLVLQDTAPEQG
ncbi:DUF2798 domain-containing protein [Alteromonas sp. chi3]|uniref:DUF2798 domain-containing protein n=2 Tax=Alteromonas gilva TaxID=2987522 RepID=A0ABT5KZU8_9ALTE|nr:DUF2798 domain-containing protein [Alteromonas gilva]